VLGADGVRIDELRAADAEALIADGTVAGGMVPKVRAALAALDGATEAVIADGAAAGALSRALDGSASGTRLRA
jgi:acetylglutamate kinase